MAFVPNPKNGLIKCPGSLKAENFTELPLVRPYDSPGFAKNGIDPGEVLRCIISCVESFDLFYVQPREQLTRLKWLQVSLSKFYTPLSTNQTMQATPLGSDLLKGRYFSAFLQRIPGEYPDWFRVQVVKILPYIRETLKIMVWLIDFGNFAILDRKDMRLMPRHFLIDFKALAIPCKFRLDCLSPEIVGRMSAESDQIGVVMRQYLDEIRQQQTIKFHSVFIEPKTNLSSWLITAVMTHNVKDELLIPGQMTLGGFIIQRYFKEGVRPKPEPTYEDWRKPSFDSSSEMPMKLPYLEDWLAEENLLEEESESGAINHDATPCYFETTAEQDTSVNRLHTVFMQPYFNGSEHSKGITERRVIQPDFLDVDEETVRKIIGRSRMPFRPSRFFESISNSKTKSSLDQMKKEKN